MKWKITQTATGVDMGVYEGETEQDALDTMARDAGYRDHADACSIYEDGSDGGASTLEVTPVEE